MASERDQLRAVRARLLAPYLGDFPKEYEGKGAGILEVLRPLEIAQMFAGTLESFQTLLFMNAGFAAEHFGAVGVEIPAFYKNFAGVRRRARKGHKRYVPAIEDLVRFGEDAPLVLAAWPAVPFLVRVLEARERALDPSLAETALWEEAQTFLCHRSPNAVQLDAWRAEVARLVEVVRRTKQRAGRPLKELTSAVQARLQEETVRNKALVYEPTSKPKVHRSWSKAVLNLARDLADSSTTDGSGGKGIPAGTLRRWKHENGGRHVSSPEDVARRNADLRAHRDPSGRYKTAAEVAVMLGYSSSNPIVSAAKRAFAAGELPLRRLPGKTGYAFTQREIKILRGHLAATRSRRGTMTPRVMARETRTPVGEILGILETNDPTSELNEDEVEAVRAATRRTRRK